ncbi:MAG TPA: undecaprenyl-phosphate glucose phosphotransferase [Hypericibacter adhaerens]|jgi:Undecaprenyl-phosphate glucose phosphotransferase|nr:undecaprenyl-phosphate glucose phosphotransferase [Hypericibacter adhaerens]HWA42731.1 undecaprenyl-phosphate glucose phosphotransferase [Hypericibacter adhaerens]
MISERRTVSLPIVSGCLRLADLVAVLGAGLIAYRAYPPAQQALAADLSLVFVVIIGLLCANGFQLAHLYTHPTLRSPLRRFGRALLAWSVVLLLFAAALFFTKTGENFSRGWVVSWFLIGAAGLGLNRIALSALVGLWTRDRRLCRNLVVVGAGAEAARFIAMVEASHNEEVEIVGVFDERLNHRRAVVAGRRLSGNIDDLTEFCRQVHVDQIVVAMPAAAESQLAAIFGRLRQLPVAVSLCPDIKGLPLENCSLGRVADQPVLNLLDRPLSDWKWVRKEIEDRFLAAIILLLIAPLLGAVALAVKIDSPGPVFFRQRRYGYNNQMIEVFKFRTMYHDQCDAAGEKVVKRGDSRVTRLGGFLRKTSLDELPQIINVLRGEMSIVGPRPHQAALKIDNRYYDEIVAEYAARHRVRPGITGWAQVNGWRGEIDTVEKAVKRVEHDLYYIDNWSVLLDFKILLLTVVAVLKRENAY